MFIDMNKFGLILVSLCIIVELLQQHWSSVLAFAISAIFIIDSNMTKAALSNILMDQTPPTKKKR